MATRADVPAIVDQLRAAQARQAAAVAAAVAVWYRQRVTAEDPETIERWLAALVPIIMRERLKSAHQTRLVGQAIRNLEIGVVDDFTFEVPEVPADIEARIRSSLVITGPKAFQSRLEKISGRDISPALERALIEKATDQSAAGAGAASIRHVLNGGRDVIRDNVQADPRALGYLRVTRAKPCYFCALLASRGAVYKGDSFLDSDSFFDGPGHYKVHDECQCGLKPVYAANDPMVDRSKEFLAVWTSVTSDGFSGPAAIREFRKRLEGRSS